MKTILTLSSVSISIIVIAIGLIVVSLSAEVKNSAPTPTVSEDRPYSLRNVKCFKKKVVYYIPTHLIGHTAERMAATTDIQKRMLILNQVLRVYLPLDEEMCKEGHH